MNFHQLRKVIEKITYNNYDDIYISPENREEFVQKLTQINPNINLINQTA